MAQTLPLGQMVPLTNLSGQEFLAAPIELTNAVVNQVVERFNGFETGKFILDQRTDAVYLAGFSSLYLDQVKSIGANALPPELNIPEGKLLKDLVHSDYTIGDGRFRFVRYFNDSIRDVSLFPSLNRYQERAESYGNIGSVDQPDVAATGLSYFEAVVIVQLLNSSHFAKDVLGISGDYFIDMPSWSEWQAISLATSQDFMTSTGKLRDDEDQKLMNFFGRNESVQMKPATDFSALPTGIYPPTVSVWLKDTHVWRVDRRCGVTPRTLLFYAQGDRIPDGSAFTREKKITPQLIPLRNAVELKSSALWFRTAHQPGVGIGVRVIARPR